MSLNTSIQKVKSKALVLWPKVKQFWNRYKVVILCILCLILFFFLIRKRDPEIRVITKDNLDLLKKVEYLEDKNKNLWAEVKQIVVSKEEADIRNDSLAKALKIKPKFIKGQDIYVFKHDTTFITTSTTVIRGKDTAYKVEKHDPYVDIVAVAGRDSGSINYSSRDTLTAIHVVKNPLIGRTTRTTYINNKSPYNRIVEGASFTTKEKKVWLSIGPSAHLNYNPFTQRVSGGIGISIQKPIIQFKR